MEESRIERRLKSVTERLGGRALKFISPGMRGVPDRIILLPGGRIAFVETKAPGKPLEPLQRKRKAELEAMGFKVYKIDSLEDIENFITEGIS